MHSEAATQHIVVLSTKWIKTQWAKLHTKFFLPE